MQCLGTLPRHQLAESLPHFSLRCAQKGREWGCKSSTQQPYNPPSPLLGALMPKPAQNSSCPGFTQWAMLNADFIAHRVRRDISPALDHLSHQGSSHSRGGWAAPNTKTCSPGYRCLHLLAMGYKAQLSSSLGMAERVF